MVEGDRRVFQAEGGAHEEAVRGEEPSALQGAKGGDCGWTGQVTLREWNPVRRRETEARYAGV